MAVRVDPPSLSSHYILGRDFTCPECERKASIVRKVSVTAMDDWLGEVALIVSYTCSRPECVQLHSVHLELKYGLDT